MVTDGLLADREALADVGIGEPLADQREDFALPGREPGEGGVLAALGRAGRETREIEDDVLEARPRGLVLEKAIGRTLSEKDKEEIKRNTYRAYRWTFLVSGLEHPNFVRIVSELTRRGPAKLEAVARALLK